MRPKPVAYFLCAVALALIAVCPLILLSEHSAAVEAAPFKGVLKLWHIQGWRTGGASFGVYLSQCIKLFESQDAYAFIEMESLTPEEAMQALESGEKPDLISFPRGQNPALHCSPPLRRYGAARCGRKRAAVCVRRVLPAG
jgi:hypothetical protein